jgi:lipoic acid synthetase
LAVDRFPEPELYDFWAEKAIELGFLGVASGPFVRSSFKAGLLLRKLKDPNNDERMPGANVLVSKDITFDQHHLRTSPTEVKP